MSRTRALLAVWAVQVAISACERPAETSIGEPAADRAKPAPESAPPVSASAPLLAGLLIEDGVYNTELTAPMDILHHTPFHAKPGVVVCTIAEEKRAIRTFEGLLIEPDHDYASAPEIDILVVPSAERHVAEDFEDAALIAFVRERAARASHVMSLCDGAFVLAKAGLLDDRLCTTFPADIAPLRERYPKARVLDGVSFVVDGKFITSVGGARSFEPALYLVETLHGRKPARGVARGMVIDWDLRRVPHYVRPDGPTRAYQTGERIDSSVEVLDRDGQRVRLLETLGEDDRLLVVCMFGGGDRLGKARRAGLWCEDSLNELPILRHAMARHGERGVRFVGIACPPIHDEERFGYPVGAHLSGASEEERRAAREALVESTESAIDSGVIPFDDVYYDVDFQLLHNLSEHPRRADDPPWLGRFRDDGEHQLYGTPTTWVLGRDGEVMMPPFYGNNYEVDRALKYTARDVDLAIAAALAAVEARER